MSKSATGSKNKSIGSPYSDNDQFFPFIFMQLEQIKRPVLLTLEVAPDLDADKHPVYIANPSDIQQHILVLENQVDRLFEEKDTGIGDPQFDQPFSILKQIYWNQKDENKRLQVKLLTKVALLDAKHQYLQTRFEPTSQQMQQQIAYTDKLKDLYLDLTQFSQANYIGKVNQQLSKKNTLRRTFTESQLEIFSFDTQSKKQLIDIETNIKNASVSIHQERKRLFALRNDQQIQKACEKLAGLYQTLAQAYHEKLDIVSALKKNHPDLTTLNNLHKNAVGHFTDFKLEAAALKENLNTFKGPKEMQLTKQELLEKQGIEELLCLIDKKNQFKSLSDLVITLMYFYFQRSDQDNPYLRSDAMQDFQDYFGRIVKNLGLDDLQRLDDAFFKNGEAYALTRLALHENVNSSERFKDHYGLINQLLYNAATITRMELSERKQCKCTDIFDLMDFSVTESEKEKFAPILEDLAGPLSKTMHKNRNEVFPEKSEVGSPVLKP